MKTFLVHVLEKNITLIAGNSPYISPISSMSVVESFIRKFQLYASKIVKRDRRWSKENEREMNPFILYSKLG